MNCQLPFSKYLKKISVALCADEKEKAAKITARWKRLTTLKRDVSVDSTDGALLVSVRIQPSK